MTEETQGILTTVYVVSILDKPSLAHLRQRQPVPMAVELPIEEAKKLAAQINARLAAGDVGAIRVHMLVELSHV
jgi:hypothetical protein